MDPARLWSLKMTGCQQDDLDDDEQRNPDPQRDALDIKAQPHRAREGEQGLSCT